MSKATFVREDTAEHSAGPPATPPGLLADPVARVMVYATLGLVVLFLATVVGVLVTGVTTPTGPRSVIERQVLTTAAQVGGKAGDASAPYIDALIAAGNLPAARVALSQARGSVTATMTAPDLDLSAARLVSAEENHAEAVSFADRAMKGYVDEYDKRVAAGGKIASAAQEIGYGENYYNAVLVKAYALLELDRFQDAVAAFDVYLEKNPTASDIFVDRGNAKAELKDTSGAEQDFRAALRFVPYDQEAQAGLKRIGVAQ